MEEQFRVELEQTSMEEDRVEEFYETIEAPKFVDFTRPNHFCPDDRYWFCSRVGCNQNHEEEMDSEAIYKNFVLRVMAARSPNVRFRRALNKKSPSGSQKCPLSAPPKSSKSRLPRLALVSSISKKLIDDDKGAIKPPPAEPASTPKARVKHVPAKYMTSPGKKKGGSPKLNAFRSVRNPKKRSIIIQTNKMVAKALVFNSPKKVKKVVFNSPKKVTKAKDSELATPITKLCEGVKKLAITSHKKVLSQKSSMECRSVRKPLPSDASSKQPGLRKTKIRQDESSGSRNCKGKNPESIRSVMGSKAKQNNKKHGGHALHEGKLEDDSSDMEVDEKSRAGSLDSCSTTVQSRMEEQTEGDSRDTSCGISQKEATSSSERPPTAESSDGIPANPLSSELISVPDSENQGSREESSVAVQEPKSEQRSKEKKSPAENDLENQNPGVVSELMDNDDKENALDSDSIRNLNGGSLSKHDALAKRKVTTTPTQRKVEKTMKENCPAAVTQGVKYRKLKPTNPKPFRLRTDERGILKEATLDKKVSSHENSTNTSENLQAAGNEASENREKGGKKVVARSFKKDQFRPIKSKYMKISKDVEPKSEKTQLISNKVVRTQRETRSQVKPRGLGVIEKSATTMAKSKDSRQQNKEVMDSTSKASVPRKIAAQGRRPTTVPREPVFHTLHKPKSCTRNVL